ncbi:MAG: dihydroorotate dehydrogenase (quinone), partial [Peptidiphaga sp.]
MLYRLVYRLVLSKTDPERIHDAAMSAIGAFGRSPLAPLASATVGHRGGDRLAGLIARPVPGRLGMAAGQDKNGTAILGTIALGFAFTEIGTVTPRPQPGNEGPRLWRIPGERAFRNRMGFNND